MKYCKYISAALVASGMMLGVLYANPACYAGGAAIIVPAEDRDIPQGSQIPEARSQEIEKKVKEHKVKMKGKSLEQQQEELPNNELPQPKASEDGN